MLSPGALTLLGITLIKFATGFTSDWGVVSLYILSYYHYHGAPLPITPKTNSLILIMLVIPIIICLIISTRLAKYVGYVRLIRLCAVGYFVLPMLSLLNFSFVMFMLCNMVIPSCAFTLSLVPIFNCMYSYYGRSKSLATGIAIGSYGVGAIFWNIVATFSVNPDNTVPDVPTSDPNFNLFSLEIADRVPRTVNIIYLTSGAIYVLASLLVTVNQQYQDTSIYEQDYNNQHIQEQTDKHNQLTPAQSAPHQHHSISLISYMKHPVVWLLFMLNIVGCLFQIYVQANTKIVYMPILQDDHLISIGLMLIIFSAAVFSVPWGYLADRRGSAVAIFLWIIVDMVFKVFAALVGSKYGFIASMVLIGSTDKTMLVLFAPIVIDFFGLQVGTELLPLKGFSGILSLSLGAVLGLAFASVEPQKVLLALCGFSVVNLVLGLVLVKQIRKHEGQKGSNQLEPEKIA